MIYLAIAAVFLAVFAGVYLLGKFVADRPTRDQIRAGSRLRAMNRASGPELAEVANAPRLDGALVAVGAWASQGKASAEVRAKLALAGFRAPTAILYYSGLQLFLVATFALLGTAAAVMLGKGWTTVALVLATGGAIGLLAPSYLLASRVKNRQRQIRSALPDALDILVMGVEGGASLNAAITWVADEIQAVHPILGAEMATLRQEIQLGLSAGEAFRSFSDRCGIAEARDLAAALLQSERYGASVAKALRAYSDAARQHRQTWAEEVAQKAAVKIMFPMLLCIFPAMFIVLLGPAAMQMSRLYAK